MAFPNDGRAIGVNRDPYSCDIDRQEAPAVLARKDALGFDRLPAPAVKAEDPVGLRDRVPALQIGQLPSIGLSGADVGAVRLTPQRLQLFC